MSPDGCDTALTHAAWRVAVVIPAMNEEARIAACVESVLTAARATPALAEIRVIVVADSCVDRTAARARAVLGPQGDVIECRARSPGTARRLGAGAALGYFRRHDRARLWLANTDADTQVPADWIARQLQLADRGMTAVAGIVQLLDEPDGAAPLAHVLFNDYEIAANGSHSHVHGANLGVRADAYLDAGGWSHRTVAEDHCLWGRLRRRGWPMTASASSVVHTSGRLHGRARGGFADTLRAKLERLRV